MEPEIQNPSNPPITAPQSTSGLAIASLVLGILGWVFLPFLASIVAVVLGHMARAEIRSNPQLDGDGMAVAGIILGYLMIGICILAFFLLVLFFGFLGLVAAA